MKNILLLSDDAVTNAGTINQKTSTFRFDHRTHFFTSNVYIEPFFFLFQLQEILLRTFRPKALYVCYLQSIMFCH